LKWDISIPHNWQYSDWNSIKLYPVRVPLPIIRCETCGEYLRVEPAFILKGTILTVNALVFASFVYEKENFTWRQIVDTFCKDNDRLSHSTIYSAVHKLSQIAFPDSLNENIPVKHNYNTLWPSLKARFAHTKEREERIRLLLTIMIVLLPYYKSFLELLIKFTDILKSSQSSQISRLLPLYRLKSNVNTS
jgi:hypothetical protein